jgi:c-di-GMP-related signal transduction protein
MHETNFIVREPLLDPKQRVVGYELSWQQHEGQQKIVDADLESLISFVAENVNDDEHGWLLRDKILFLDAVPAMLSTDALFNMPPDRTVLTLKAADLADADTLAAAQGLRAGGVGISVRDGELTHLGKNLGLSASWGCRPPSSKCASRAPTWPRRRAPTPPPSSPRCGWWGGR